MSVEGYLLHNQDPLCFTHCIGACCMEGGVIEFTPEEADHLTAQGTNLEPFPTDKIPENTDITKGRVLYRLLSDCGNLDQETRKCKVFGQPERPAICSEFKAGQAACNFARTSVAKKIQSGKIDLPMPVVPKYNAMVRDPQVKAPNVQLDES